LSSATNYLRAPSHFHTEGSVRDRETQATMFKRLEILLGLVLVVYMMSLALAADDDAMTTEEPSSTAAPDPKDDDNGAGALYNSMYVMIYGAVASLLL